MARDMNISGGLRRGGGPPESEPRGRREGRRKRWCDQERILESLRRVLRKSEYIGGEREMECVDVVGNVKLVRDRRFELS